MWTEGFVDADIDNRQLSGCLSQPVFEQYLVVELAYRKRTAIARSREGNLRLSRLYAEKVFGPPNRPTGDSAG